MLLGVALPITVFSSTNKIWESMLLLKIFLKGVKLSCCCGGGRGLRSRSRFGWDETGGHFRIAKTMTRLHMSGTVTGENSGKNLRKIWDGTGLLSTTREKS